MMEKDVLLETKLLLHEEDVATIPQSGSRGKLGANV
jgi:hypothetical protein